MKIIKQLGSIVNEFIEKNGKLIAGTVEAKIEGTKGSRRIQRTLPPEERAGE